MNEAGKLFATTFGGSPQGIWAAPGRANLIGEHTDYNQGLVLPFALGQRTWVAAAIRDDARIRVVSQQASGEGAIEFDLEHVDRGDLPNWVRYVAGVIRALNCESGFDLAIDGRVPLGSGLSSSAALMCAVAVAANDLAGLNRSRMELAEAGQRAENDFVGAPTGMMDEVASLFGTAGHALLFDVRSRAIEQIPFDPAAHGVAVVIIDTRVSHALAESEYGDRRASCERAVDHFGLESLRDLGFDDLDRIAGSLDDRTFRRVRHVVTENVRVVEAAAALRADDWVELAGLMSASHVSLRDDYEVSCAELDAAVDLAIDAGALGARMMGGGFGGSAIVLIPLSKVDDLKESVSMAFAQLSYAAPAVLEVSPGPSAGRVE
ncbi:MAG: galactokinase [Acidimicrobiia bacterium]|nr:galactokinase [Acidimicrobiia bacterium]